MRIFFCLIFFVPFITSGQKNVRVLDFQSNSPIPFATIAFKQKNQGFNTNMNGDFIIPIECNDDTLIVSSVGYLTSMFQVQGILGRNSIFLERDIQILDTTIIRKRTNQTTLNNQKEKNLVPTFLTTLSHNYQAAQLFEAPGKDVLIKKIEINLKEAKELYKFRLRFYDFNESTGGPGNNICDEVIEVQTKSKSLSVDLENYYITSSSSRFFIAIEWIISQENEFIWPDHKERTAYFPIIASYVNQPCSIWVLSYRGEWSKYHCSYPKALKIYATVSY